MACYLGSTYRHLHDLKTHKCLRPRYAIAALFAAALQAWKPQAGEDQIDELILQI